ncbi:MAG TPA: Na+/H+ antiporter subunit E [Mycobacteriales bacterium]|nr:Na+/H+ antiporter subunit E [Mycobacteriales bacterium]
MSAVERLTRSPAMLGWLTVVWVGLWGSVTVANVLGGLAVAAVLLVLLPVPQRPDQGRVRLLPLLRFVGFFAVELVRASAVVVWQVLRGGRPRQAVLAVPAAGSSDRLLTLVANAVSLTPGTLTLEVDRERSVLYVHALDVGGPDGVERARRSIQRLERLAVLAVGTDEARQRVAGQGEVRA